MAHWLRRLKRLPPDRRGATAIEYGLIVALIVIAMIAGAANLGSQSGGLWGNMSGKVVNAL